MFSANASNPKSRAALAQAMNLSREFFDFEPRFVNDLDIDWPRALVLVGRCPRVDYVTDKWDGRRRRYFHEFTFRPGQRATQLLVDPALQADGSQLLVIRGFFRIEPEGIHG